MTLFFTDGLSLQEWDRLGIFSRELAIYHSLQERGVAVQFVTYGDANDLQFQDQLNGMKIFCNQWHLPPCIYRRAIPWLHRKALLESHLLKTNQTLGGAAALRAARRFELPLIARCGYMYSATQAQIHGTTSTAVTKAHHLEELLFTSADKIIVTTPAMVTDIMERLSPTAEIHVIPNYVDTNLFQPATSTTRDLDLLFIGRYDFLKNIDSLLEAVSLTNFRITMIGPGQLPPPWRDHPCVHSGQIRKVGIKRHDELPGWMNRAQALILPSLYEGHPKVLIEAMACGLPVIGSDVPGIRELIRHGENGYLCETTSHSIRNAVQEVLTNAELRATLGAGARQFAKEHFSLEQIAVREHQVIQSTLTVSAAEDSFDPQISVVMPVYNAQEFLAPAMQSILDQSFDDFEFIIIDDGSTDATAAIISQQSGRDSRIRLLRQEHAGTTAALNHGIREARGKYIARMDADDISLPDRFEKQVSFLEDHPEMCAVGAWTLRIDQDGDPLCVKQWHTDHAEIVAWLEKGLQGLPHPTAMIRTEAIHRIGGYCEEYPLAQDLDLWLRLSETAKLANLPEVLLKYRHHKRSITACQRREQLEFNRVILVDTYQRRGLRCDPAILDWQVELSESWEEPHQSALLAARNGYFSTARKYAFLSLAHRPWSMHTWHVIACAYLGRPFIAVSDRLGSLLSFFIRPAGRRRKYDAMLES
jgi:glycosyltransferase involved in cell wall biosynthesis